MLMSWEIQGGCASRLIVCQLFDLKKERCYFFVFVDFLGSLFDVKNAQKRFSPVEKKVKKSIFCEAWKNSSGFRQSHVGLVFQLCVLTI